MLRALIGPDDAVIRSGDSLAKGDTAISNGKIIADTPGPGEGKHTLRFSPSPRMNEASLLAN
ncbi:MAG: hypothetical protein ABSH01_16145 [Terriglobia bacterium]